MLRVRSLQVEQTDNLLIFKFGFKICMLTFKLPFEICDPFAKCSTHIVYSSSWHTYMTNQIKRTIN